MNDLTAPPDQAERDQALDPSRSFIVQAPAGSGKTELLIQRYLRLLACVDEPEEVLAVTFTRKAAGEMRNRVMSALRQADYIAGPAEPHLTKSREIARAILQDPRRQAWQLHRHPARLSISTIDAINAWLAGRAPVGAGRSAMRRISDAPEELYREAARAALRWLGTDDESGRNVATILRHLDNDTNRFERLIMAMLPRRDQWLRQVVTAQGDRAAMEAPLRQLTAHSLQLAAEAMTDDFRTEATALLSFAGAGLQAAGRESPVCLWAEQSVFPAPEPGRLALWQALSHALLTAEHCAWRKSVDVRHGFPPRTPQKARMQELLARCAARPLLLERLHDVRMLPGAGYSDGQWQVLRALLEVLRLAAAELKLVSGARRETDFAEVAADALQALGDAMDPSELGLALDHRIRHILVDEFQDTSLSQFELLRGLTAGWQSGDGRTLFLVGDPMQSIYRFRQAEVGVFMSARDDGVGDLRPEFLQLKANFRSDDSIVTWVNSVFRKTFPTQDDPVRGAVRFSESLSRRQGKAGEGTGVTLHWLPAGDAALEGRTVADIVRDAVRTAPEARICVLVRSRSHASHIIAAMRTSGVRFIAHEIENLAHSSVAQDLLALTRALLHPADRLAWIGVLRAPWCGLSLADLHELLADDRHRPVPEILREGTWSDRLSADGRLRLHRMLAVVERVDPARGRRSLRDLVEGAWLELAGPATMREEAEMESAAEFLALLDSVEAGADCADLVALGLQLAKRKGSLGGGNEGVQIMTMHKAKGLEFDTVVLPGLGRVPRREEPPLLASQEVLVGAGRTAPILSPMAPTGAEKDPLYRYLMQLEHSKQAAESDRLLYVACTRARRRLHLLAQIELAREAATGVVSVRRPKAGSLLERLWPALEEEAAEQAGRLPLPPGDDRAPHMWVQPKIRRLPAAWKPPPSPLALHLSAGPDESTRQPLAYEWASHWAMHAGSVVHQWLRVIAQEGTGRFEPVRLRRLQPVFRRQLASLGTEPRALDRASQRVLDALLATLSDGMGRWILSGDHADARCELPLTICEGDRFRHVVIDRTFIAADGHRWLIDYKTSTHEGADLHAFLRLETERHLDQLRLYRTALAALGPAPIRVALYFPVLSVFEEVCVDADQPAG